MNLWWYGFLKFFIHVDLQNNFKKFQSKEEGIGCISEEIYLKKCNNITFIIVEIRLDFSVIFPFFVLGKNLKKGLIITSYPDIFYSIFPASVFLLQKEYVNSIQKIDCRIVRTSMDLFAFS